MAEKKRGFARLMEELRNRRVFRVAAVYLGIGFAALEATDIVVPMLGLPTIIPVIVLGLLMLGFPIATTLAWHYQMTDEGLRKSPRSGEKQTSKEKPWTGNWVTSMLLVLILVLLVYPRFRDAESQPYQETLVDAKSVAVLPFTPFTKTMEDESFADGVHDDILTQLSKIADLKVISRTSVMQYKGTTKLVSDIANELDVANILEGSVRRAGDQIRIVAQLINAKTDEHLWAETFDRQYADIFSIQTEVAKKIARALKAELTPSEEQYISALPTKNREAWEVFTRAELLAETGATNIDSASSLYEQAGELDPEFLLPFARLAKIHAHAYFDGNGRDPSPGRLDQAKQALQRAIAMNPDAPETHLAQGYFHYYGSRDYQQALDAFYLAQSSQPNNSDLLEAIGYVERRLGQWDKCWEHLEKAVALDPNNLGKVSELWSTAQMMRKWEVSEKYQQHASAIGGGNDPEVEMMQYWHAFRRYGDTERLQVIFDDLVSRFPGDNMRIMRRWHPLFVRDFEAGLAYNTSHDDEDNTRGVWLAYTGDQEAAAAYFDSRRIVVEEKIAKHPKDVQAFLNLGFLLARLDKHDDAIRMGQQAVELMPLSKDAVLGSDMLEGLAGIYTDCGLLDEALEIIEQLLLIPSDMTPAILINNPRWDALREHPQFGRITGIPS